MAPSRCRSAMPALCLVLLLCAPAGAAEAPRPVAATDGHAPSVWLYSLYKTITYETAANLSDIPLYPLLLAGAQTSTALFTTLNVASAAAAYYAYEVGWSFYGPAPAGTRDGAIHQEIGKALLYRVVSTTRNLALGYALTGSGSATFAFILVNNVVDTVLYVANEYGWYRWGPPTATVWANVPGK